MGDKSFSSKGLHKYRFQANPLEKAFAQRWHDENKYGHILEYLLSLDNRKVEVTEREQEVADTVIQWLGSPVGCSFIIRVLKEHGWKIDLS